MEYQEYKKKYENMKIKYRKLYEEIGEGKEKKKRYMSKKQRID